MSYLHSSHSNGKSYSVVNTHKSFLLQTLYNLGNQWSNSPRLISRFMRGIFIVNPCVQRYKFIWNVSKVLGVLSSWDPLESLCLKTLTLKLTALIALAYMLQEFRLLSP